MDFIRFQPVNVKLTATQFNEHFTFAAEEIGSNIRDAGEYKSQQKSFE